MDKKVLIALILLLLSICILIAFYYIFKPNAKASPPPSKSKTPSTPPTPPTKPNPSGMAVLNSGYFLDNSGNEIISDDGKFGAYITRVKSPTYTGPQLVIAPYNPVPNSNNGLAVSKVEILNNGYLQFYKPDGTAPPEYTKVSGLNSYMKFDSNNILSFYNGSNNLKGWDINHGDYTYPMPDGASILTSGFCLDTSGNTLVSDDKSHKAFIITPAYSVLIVTPDSTIPNGRNFLQVSKVEILYNGNIQFYAQDGSLPNTNIVVGGLKSYMKFDSSNVLSFYNAQNIKLWDINLGDYT